MDVVHQVRRCLSIGAKDLALLDRTMRWVVEPGRSALTVRTGTTSQRVEVTVTSGEDGRARITLGDSDTVTLHDAMRDGFEA